MEESEANSDDTCNIYSERFASRVNISSVHLMYDYNKLQIINFILSKVPEISQIYELSITIDMKSEISTYTGQMVENLKWGIGLEEFTSGFKYYGEYEKDQPNGIGLLIISDSQYYKGTFKDGQFHGKGEFHNENDYYIGEWFKDMKHGYGEELCQKSLYKGWFNTGSKYGKGKLFVLGESIENLVQEWQEDCVEIIKKIKEFADFIYSGEFKNDLFHGEGKIKMQRGEFVRKVRGVFEEGKLVDGDIKFSDNSPIKNVTGKFADDGVKSCEITFEDGKVVRGICKKYL
jgi:hypothetical protein